MSEIVFTQTWEDRHAVADMQHGRRQTDRKVTIFRSPGKVCSVVSTLVVGVPVGRPNGYREPLKDKRYYYWRSIQSSGFRRNSAGNIVPFHCTRPWDAKVGTQWSHKPGTIPFNFLEVGGQDDEVGQAFQHAVWQEFDIRKIQDIYPRMEDYGLSRYDTIPNSMRQGFRLDNIAELTAATFGKTRTTPRLVAAVAKTDPYIVAYAQQFRGLVDNDKITAFIERNHFDDEMEEWFTVHSPNIRPGLLLGGKDMWDGLISETLDSNDLRRVYNMVYLGRENVKRYFRLRSKAKTLAEIHH